MIVYKVKSRKEYRVVSYKRVFLIPERQNLPADQNAKIKMIEIRTDMFLLSLLYPLVFLVGICCGRFVYPQIKKKNYITNILECTDPVAKEMLLRV